MKGLPLAGLVVLTFLAGSAQAARLVVEIEGIRSASGSVYVALFSKPEGFPDGNFCDQHMKIAAAAKPLTVIFDNVTPGNYAVGAYHDENNNDHFDTDLVGQPLEGYALSNGVRAVMAKPTFQQAAFTVGTADTPISLQIRY